jgi:hypothetical protein
VLAAFQVQGTCESTSWRSSGEKRQSLKFAFIVRSVGRTWSIRVDDLAAKTGGRDSADYSELAFDGQDQFAISHFPDRMVTNAVGLPGVETYGVVREATFPKWAGPVEKLLWLLFCSGAYPPLTTSSFPEIENSCAATNLVDVAVEYFSSELRLPKTIKVWSRGTLVFEHATGRPLPVQPTGLPAQGYVAFDLQSSAIPGEAEPSPTKRQVTAEYYGLDFHHQPPKPFLSTVTSMTAEASGIDMQPIGAPELIGKAAILDARYRQPSGLSYYYVETSHSWMTRSDPDPNRTLRSKRLVPVVGAAQRARRPGFAAWLVVLVLIVPAPFFASSGIFWEFFIGRDRGPIRRSGKRCRS